jgi:drug/metabolite transporter (DMT)-like permease
VLAAASGVGFGVFQSVNARAVRGAEDPFASTLVQVGVAAAALTVASLLSGDLLDAVDAPLWALGDFALAGMLHFLAGWSLLNLSQQRIGAARTSPLLTTVPVFGLVIAAVTIGQLPGPLAVVAIAIMCVGAYLVAMRGGRAAPTVADALPGLGCAFLWALSPIFILRGLEGFDSALVGLNIGLLVSVAAYVPAYALWRGAAPGWQAVRRSAVGLKLLAGLLVGVSTWWRWAALEDTAVGPVLALALLSVPVVLLLAPVLAGRHVEKVTGGLVAGAGLVVSGALILIVA